METAAECKISLSDSIKTAIKSNGIVGMTLNVWTDIKLRHFLCITAHFVENSKLESGTLTVFEFLEETKSGLNLLNAIADALAELEITRQDMFKHIYFTTDNGSNIKEALGSYHRVSCACH